MRTCHLCKTDSVIKLLDIGLQPISNRFMTNPNIEQYKHPIVIGQCDACGLVQLINPVPADKLLAPYEWIRYKEPEGHLDQLADIISNLQGITKDAVICGLSYKEDSILERLRCKGFFNTCCIDKVNDLGITDARAGIEAIQDRLMPQIANILWKKYGRSDVIIARHILEHTHNPLQFIKFVQKLVKPAGYVVLEVPDCTQMFETFDYTMIWEEHILYFTPETFRHALGFGGFSLVCFKSFPYPYENSLIAIVRPQRNKAPALPLNRVLKKEKVRAKAFAQGLIPRRATLNRFFFGYRQRQDKVAMFGAGHLACMFINLMGLKDFIEFVVDDHPQKQGLFMPGSRLPIYSSEVLIKENIRLCLTSLSPESEENVMQKNQAFLKQGGTFASIFPTSKHALQV